MNKKGLTLIELIALLVILGIISTIAIFSIGNTVNRAKVEVDSYNLGTLNLVTEKYATGLSGITDDIFEGLNTDDARMNALVQSGYIYQPIQAQQNNASFTWDTETQTWLLVGGDTIEVILTGVSYDFSEDDLELLKDDGSIASRDRDWDSINGVLETDNYTELFIPIHALEYTITVEASISEGTGGGYGIFFETILINDNPDRDTGYILQFDRGYADGTILVRPREDGDEQSPVWQLRASQTDLFPTKTEDPSWWTDTHTISITVEVINDTMKEATFFLDENELGSYIITSATAGETIYTGFRNWWTTSSFYRLQIE